MDAKRYNLSNNSQMYSKHLAKFKTKILGGHERTIKAKKNILISFIVRGASILIGLMLIPLTINYVNTDQYGIWLTLSSLISWFNLLDIGLGSGLKNKIAEANATGNQRDAKIYVSTTYFILFAIAIVIFSLFAVINTYINWETILNIHYNKSDLQYVALVVFGAFCLQLVIQLISVVLTASHNISKVSYIALSSQIITLISVFILTKTTEGNLSYLVFALSGGVLITQIIASFIYFNGKYKFMSPSFKFIELKHAKSLLSLGGIFFLIQIGGLVLFQTDNLIIVRMFGPKDVTTYNIAYRLFSNVTMLFAIFMAPFWSAFTDAYTKNDFHWIEQTFKKMYKYWAYQAVVCCFLLAISPFIYKIWLGDKVVVPFSLSLAMAFYAMGYSWLMIHCYLLNGIGKLKMQLYMYIISTIINIPIAIFLGRHFGISGVTYSNIIVFVYMGWALYIQCGKIISKTDTGIWSA